MSTGLLPPLGDNDRYAGRRGLLSTVIPIITEAMLLTTETFSNEPPAMSLISTETFSNEPPSVSLVTTEGFDNSPSIGSLVTAEGFDGYDWNPNALFDCLKDGSGGDHINVSMTLEQEDGEGNFHQLKQTPFGTILDLSYPARQHRITVPASVTISGIIYDAQTTTLTYSGDYHVRTIYNFIYTRRAGQ